MKDRAYAKINLALDVFNIRSDGYHDLKSIMIPINFYDELEINIATNNKYVCDKDFIYFDDNNSIIKMINAVKEKFNINDNYYVNLKKSIPIQAGLGGGTSDGASALRILKKLYKLNLSILDEKELCLKVGADVLFNYYNKPAIVEGIGDKVKPFINKTKYYVLLIKPRLGVSTKQAYEMLDMNICDHPNIDALKVALENGDEINDLLGNSLEQPALILNHEISTIKQKLIDAGCKTTLMSGSGSTVFALSKNKEELTKYGNMFEKGKYFVRFTETLY